MGVRPLILLDQYDDFLARHWDRFLQPATRTWIPAKQLAARSAYWQLIRTLLAERATHVLVATRDDYADGLECIRFLSKPRTYRLLPLERGFISQIIGRLTTRKPDEAQVIAEPEHGWTRLRDRLVADLEARGAVLPQQLKVVLGGLRALRNLTLVEYGRAGGLGGLEASFVERSISRAARASGLENNKVLFLLLTLVDRGRQPPAKAAPQPSVGIATHIGASDSVVRVALSTLGDDEVVRARGIPEGPDTPWQIDHDYLAEPILRVYRNRDHWRSLLTERLRRFKEAGPNLWRRWRALLPLKEQALLLFARLRGRFQYSEYRRYAIASSVRLVPVLIIGVGIASAWWAVGEYNRAQLIWGRLSLSDQIRPTEVIALSELARASWLVRCQFARELFGRPDYAERFNKRPGRILRGLVGLDDSRQKALFESYFTLTLVQDPTPEVREAVAKLGASISPALISSERARALLPVLRAALIQPAQTISTLQALAQAYQAAAVRLDSKDASVALASILAALKQTERDRSAMDVLTKTYQEVAGKLDRNDASAAKESILSAMKDSSARPFVLRAVAQLYWTVAAKLDSKDVRADEALAPILAGLKETARDPDVLLALAQAYQAIAAKLDGKDAYANQVLVPILAALKERRGNPDALRKLARAYQAVAEKLDSKDAHAGEALEPVLATPTQRNKFFPWYLVLERSQFIETYLAVARKLDSKDAPRALEGLLAALKTEESNIFDFDRAFSATAAKLASSDTPQALALMLATLIGVGDDIVKAEALIRAYPYVAAKLDSKDAPGALAPILTALKEPVTVKNLFVRPAVLEAYRAVADRLDAKDAAGALVSILAALNETGKNPNLVPMVLQAYRAVAAKLDSKDVRADEALAPILAALEETARDPDVLLAVAQAYQAIAAKLDGKDAYANQVLVPILAALKERRGNPDALRKLAQAYQAVAEKLDSKDAHAGEALEPILTALNQPGQDPKAMATLAQAYQAIVEKLDSKKTQYASEALKSILIALNQPGQDSNAMESLAEAYQAVVANLDNKDARADQALTSIVAALKVSGSDLSALDRLLGAYRRIATKLDNKRASADATLEPILMALKQPGQHPLVMRALAEAYQASAAKLDGKDARADEAVAPILASLKESSAVPSSVVALARAYRAVAGKLENAQLEKARPTLLSRLGDARSSDSFFAIVEAVTSTSQTVPWDRFVEIIVEMMWYPLSDGDTTSYLLTEAHKKVSTSIEAPKPKEPWGSDHWAFIAWVRGSLAKIDLSRGPMRIPALDVEHSPG